MSHNTSAIVNQQFIEQLEFIDLNIQELTRLYYSNTPLNERIKDFFGKYVRELEAYLETNKPMSTDMLPKVFIGTSVSLLFEGESETEDYHICLPRDSNPDEGMISFLSPVGRQLLLQPLGEEILLRTPSGEVPVKIEKILLHVPVVSSTLES